jgi:hypothetical protein
VFGLVPNQLSKMKILEFQHTTHLAAVYYNGGKINLFRIHIDVTLDDLKHQLTQLNNVSTSTIKEG